MLISKGVEEGVPGQKDSLGPRQQAKSLFWGFGNGGFFLRPVVCQLARGGLLWRVCAPAVCKVRGRRVGAIEPGSCTRSLSTTGFPHLPPVLLGVLTAY